MTRNHHDPDATPAHLDQFWTDDADWTPSDLDRPDSRVTVGAGATVSGWWNSLLGGSAASGRTHGTPAAGSPRPISDVGDGDQTSGAWFVEPRKRSTRRGGLDPMVARIGGLVIAVTLAVPLVLGFTSSSDDESLRTATETSTPAEATTQTIPLGVSETDESLETSDDSTSSTSSTSSTAGTSEQSSSSATATDALSSPAPAAASSADTGAATTAAPTTAAPTTAAPSTAATSSTAAASRSAAPAAAASSCGSSYEVAAGDFWIRIADSAGVSLSSLLDVNDATTDTALLPGRSICLPVGASRPAPPPAPTTAAPTTAAPRPTTTSPPATNAPVTTQPPAPAPTTTSPPRTNVSASEAEAIIRSVWPDELEDRAVLIAWRESRHQPDAYNGSCCYGLFQMYYTVHRSWLTAYGINSASDLYDPVKNARAAYALYQRAGGWGPWSQTAFG